MGNGHYAGIGRGDRSISHDDKGWERLVISDEFSETVSPAASTRFALLCGDPESVRRHAAAIHASGPWFEGAKSSALAWCAWLEGESTKALELAQPLRVHAVSGFRIDALLVQALTCMDDDPAESLRVAREASQQARRDSLPHWEFLAALVLARARRYARQPLFASTILLSLGQWTPECYDAWRNWEMLLVQRKPEDAARFEELCGYWAKHVPFDKDAQAVRSLATPSDGAYAEGITHTAPRGLDGLNGARGAMMWGPIGHARRVWPEQDVDAPSLIDLRGESQKRTVALACCLAATPSVKFHQGFRRTYGLDYVPGRHKRTFRVLLHRLRKMLERFGVEVLEQEDETLSMTSTGIFVAYDPRTVPFEDATTASLLQSQSRLTTKRVMEQLDVPRRTAQDQLRRLVAQGILRLDGSEYVCEDTLYRDPTRAKRREST